MMFRGAVYLPECLDELLSISQVLNVQKSLHSYFFSEGSFNLFKSSETYNLIGAWAL
jgi:hypothetical protein